MQKKFKLTSLLLAAMLVLSACGGATTSDAPATASSSAQKTSSSASQPAIEGSYGVGKLPIVKEKITFTAIIPSIGWVPDIAANQMNQYLEEQTNIHIEWMEVTKEEYTEKLAILIAGNEHPDIIIDDALTKAKVDEYGQQGLFVDVGQYMDTYSTNLKEIVAEYPQISAYMTANDGGRYFVPSYDLVYHLSMPTKFWINQAWLTNLGLSMPSTTEEFKNVLTQFKEQDANGNGDANDEIPLTGAMRHFEDTASFLISAFIPAGGVSCTNDPSLNNYAFIIDGKPTFTADKDAFKEGVAYIKSLFDAGLYDPAAFTQDREQIKPLVDGGSANRVGGTVSHHPGNFATQTDTVNGRYLDFVALPPLKGPSGFQSTAWNITQGMQVGGIITNKCADPVAAFIWLDYFLNDDIATISKIGWEGVNWKAAAVDTLGFNGQPAVFTLLKAPIHEDNTILGFLGPKNSTILNGTQAVSDGYDYEQILYEATMKYEPSQVAKYPFLSMAFNENDAAQLLDLSKNLESYVGESVDRFIMGDLSLETDWDAYIQTLNQIGLADYMALLDKYYATYQQ